MKERAAFEALVFEALDQATSGIESLPEEDAEQEVAKPRLRRQPIVSLAEYLEEQVKNQRPAYQFRDSVCFYSHKGIQALTEGDLEELSLCEKRLKELWGELGNLNLPKDIQWRFDSSAAQEIVEMDQVCFFWPGVRDGKIKPSEMKHYSVFLFWSIKPQAWLAGLGDTASEVGKVMIDYLYAHQASIRVEEQLAMRDRYVQFLSAVHEKVSEYKGTPGNIINNNRFRGQDYSKILGRAARIIRETKERELLINNIADIVLKKGGIR